MPAQQVRLTTVTNYQHLSIQENTATISAQVHNSYQGIEGIYFTVEIYFINLIVY